MTDKKEKHSGNHRPIPIPPLSVVRLAHSDKETPGWQKKHGNIFRIGYCSKQDGLDYVWLVNEAGKYEQTTDHEFLYRYFDVIQFADHKNWYGHKRPIVPPIYLAGRTKQDRRAVESFCHAFR